MTRDSIRMRRAVRVPFGTAVLPMVIVLVVLVVFLGISGSFQVSSSRKLLEKIHAKRLLATAADSAFEEVSARLEGLNQNMPLPSQSDLRPNTRRDARALLSIPSTIDPELTNDAVKGVGVTLGSVQLTSSPWIMRGAADKVNRRIMVQEVGILELKVKVTVKAGSSTVEGVVSCRRHMDISPDGKGQKPRLHVLPRNMVLQLPTIS